jgi:polyphosphate kinase
MTGFRCELLSADQLAALASGPLPSGLAASDARREIHRDVYLDTSDDALRRRGIVCRLRTSVDGRGTLRLDLPGLNGSGRVEAATRGADVRAVLATDSAVVRRLRGVVDPAALEVRVDLEVDRLSRSAVRDWLGRPRVDVHLDRITVRRGASGSSSTYFQMCAHQHRGDGEELRRLVSALEEDHGVRSSAMGARERAELALKWARLDNGAQRIPGGSDRLYRTAGMRTLDPLPQFFNSELSLLSFQDRVLALAEDPDTPLAERLRFVAIVGANVDEFFMVRMAGLSAAASETNEEQSGDGLTPSGQLTAIHDAVHDISLRQAACLADCLAEMRQHGLRLVRWAELTASQQESLTARFHDVIHPLLTPFAMTLSPGHPLPRLSHLSLAIATIVRSRAGGPPRFAELELPRSIPRFIEVDGDPGAVIAIEELVRSNLAALYPESTLEQAFVFRVTRSAELDLDEAHADDLLDEVARAAAQRGQGMAVRLEVERSMPGILRALLLDNLRRELPPDTPPLVSDVEEVDGLLDLAALTQLPIPDDAALRYPPFVAEDPFAGSPSVFSVVARGDVLVHHPFESFAASVTRFVRDAADDDDVLAIKITLYRVGNPSPIADALLAAARRGKAVTVFVELKARFDENVNVAWARSLEAAGGHVVRGFVGYKNHAKVALVIRREADGALRRYVHVGTGNYNARSGEQYTDLSLFTTADDVAADVADLFNDLTGLSEPPQRVSRALLVAPHHLLPGILEQIERESAHARAGRPARITAKFNGLSDPEVVRALYRASRDGVQIDLIVRGICTLVPGVPGRSDRIRVVSAVGRFLEHSRIYRFANGGDVRYFIGSADLRPRNLRRRVELLVPIRAEAQRVALDDLMSRYLNDPTVWQLGPEGYTR